MAKRSKKLKKPKHKKRIKRFKRRIRGKTGKRRSANSGGGRTYYGLNQKFQFLQDLKNLMLRPPPASFNRMAKRIASLGRVKLALVSGVFLNKENVADLLVVGDDVDRRKFKNFLKSLEAEVGTQIIYAIMDREEFNYRRAMFDRFVRLLMEGPHEILIDKIPL